MRHLSFSRNLSSYINLYPPGFTSPSTPEHSGLAVEIDPGMPKYYIPFP